MKLLDLLRDVPLLSIEGSADIDIAEVRDDSRALLAGDLFVALPGATVDGHDFLPAAEGAAAAAVVVERDVPAGVFSGTRVRVASSAQSLAHIAARRFGDPAKKLRLIGVTGTNGKTTTTYLIEAILEAAGRRPGVIGTVNYRVGGRTLPAPFTTPTALTLHSMLAEMHAAGATDVVMETSSHALALGRLEGLEFRVGAFTNLTQDHLDFHGSMEDYFEAKALLVRRHLRPSDGVGVVLIDGPFGARMASHVTGERLIVSMDQRSADLHVRSSESTLAGITALLSSPLGAIRVRSRLVGRYNLENILVAASVAVALGVSLEAIERGLEAQAGVPGRMERVEASPVDAGTDAAAPTVLVDYAHSHDALENVIAALRPLTRGRIICVFGCGGDRDRTKRPRMGRVVAERADVAVVTSDNPRTEDPHSIIEMILAGVRDTGLPPLEEGPPRGYVVEADRRQAIDLAIAAAGPHDVVLIAGKGHEDYQIIGKTKHPFDDRLVARAALDRRAGHRSSHV